MDWQAPTPQAWTIAKVAVEAGEDVLATARRKFQEKTIVSPPFDVNQIESVTWNRFNDSKDRRAPRHLTAYWPRKAE